MSWLKNLISELIKKLPFPLIYHLCWKTSPRRNFEVLAFAKGNFQKITTEVRAGGLLRAAVDLSSFLRATDFIQVHALCPGEAQCWGVGCGYHL